LQAIEQKHEIISLGTEWTTQQKIPLLEILTELKELNGRILGRILRSDAKDSVTIILHLSALSFEKYLKVKYGPRTVEVTDQVYISRLNQIWEENYSRVSNQLSLIEGPNLVIEIFLDTLKTINKLKYPLCISPVVSNIQ
jgi:hypothetical protein